MQQKPQVDSNSSSNTPIATQTSTVSVNPRILSAINTISQLAEKYWEIPDPADVTFDTLASIKKALTKVPAFSSEEFKEIVAGLKTKGISLDQSENTSQSLSLNTYADSIYAAISKKGKTANSSAVAVGPLTCPYFEHVGYDYFSVTSTGDVVCLIPFMAEESGISSENTCKVGETMKEALGLNGKAPKILKILHDYLSDLTIDFGLLGIKNLGKNADVEMILNIKSMELAEKTDESSVLLKGKIKRYLQLKRYERMLDQIVGDPAFKEDLSGSDMAAQKLPAPITKAVKNSNAASFLIAPQLKEQDNYTRLTPFNVFSVQRPRIGIPGETVQNSKYASGFANCLNVSLGSLTSTQLQAKRPPEGLTKESLILQIEEAYLKLTGKTRDQENQIPFSADDDVTQVRKAACEVIKKMLPAEKYAGWEEVLLAPYRNNNTKQNIEDAKLFAYLENSCIEPNNVSELLTMYIFIHGENESHVPILLNDIGALPGSPFDSKEVKTAPKYNELIQIFLATANIAYYEYAHANSLSPNKINFGEKIESTKNVFGVATTQADLINTIKNAILEKKPLEEVILSWLETNILASQPEGLKKFTPETRARIKQLFQQEYAMFYPDAPHLDEFLIVTRNSTASPKVVTYRSTMAIPLDIFCENYDAKPWLASEFKPNAHRMNLPKASEIKSTSSDGFSVEADPAAISSSASFQTNIQSNLDQWLTQDPAVTAKWLLHKNVNGNRIYQLLQTNQINTLMSHQNWSAISNHMLQLLPSVKSEQDAFKKKFQLQLSMHLTRDIEHALYAHYGQNNSLSELNALSREAKIEKILGKTNIVSINKTANSTYIVKFANQQSINKIEKIVADNKNRLHVTPDMARGLYLQIGDSTPEAVLVAQAPSRWDSGNNSTLNANLTLDAKFPRALKMLFPDLCFMVQGQPFPEGKTMESPDVVFLSYNSANPNYGYEVKSTNPDNLYRIRECYEQSIAHVLSSLEAGKILQAELQKKNSSERVTLNTESLEKALDALEIIYTSVVAVGSTYRIVCDEPNWKKLNNERQKCPVIDPNKVDLDRALVPPETVVAFFKAIADANTNQAKQLLSENPNLLNTKDARFQSTPLISAIAVAGDMNCTEANRTKLLAFCHGLIKEPAIELTHTENRGNTVLHRSIYYAYTKESNPLIQKAFDEISLAIWERARREGTQKDFLAIQNQSKETIFGAVSQLSTAGVFDPKNRVKEQFARQDFANLLRERRYYDIQPACDFLNTLIDKTRYSAGFLKKLVTEKPQGSKKVPLQMAIEQGNLDAVMIFLNLGALPNDWFETDSNEKEIPLSLVNKLIKTTKDPVLLSKLTSVKNVLIQRGANLDAFYEMLSTENAQLKKENQVIQERLNTLGSENKALKETNENLLQNNPDVSKNTKKNAEIAKKNQALETEYTQLSLDNQALETKYDEVSSYKFELMTSINEKNKILPELESKEKHLIDSIADREERNAALQTQIEAQKQAMKKIQTSLEQETKVVSDQEKAYAELGQRKKTLEKEHETLTSSIEENRKANTALVKEKASLEKEIPFSTETIATLKATKGKLDEDIELKTQERKNLEERLQEETTANEEIKKSLGVIQTANIQLSERLNTETQTKTTNEATLATTIAENKRLQGQSDEALKTKNTLGRTIAENQTKITELEKQKSTQTTRIDGLVSEEADAALSQRFYKTLKQNKTYATLVSPERIQEIKDRIDPKSKRQDPEKNRSKAALLERLRNMVNENQSFSKVQQFMMDNKGTITTTTRRANGLFFGEVTSKKLFEEVEKLFEDEAKLRPTVVKGNHNSSLSKNNG